VSLGDFFVAGAADTGRFDVRGMFNRVAKHLIDEGVATKLELDAAQDLRMAGDENKVGSALEDVLHNTLNFEQQDGSASPSVAVMAYEEKGKVHFIALRTGDSDGALPMDAAALQVVNEAAGQNGGEAWAEPDEEGQICRFTLDGDKANSKRRDSKKRSGWRPAQSKAVWNMGSQDKRSRN
jgi:hypothetical protein